MYRFISNDLQKYLYNQILRHPYVSGLVFFYIISVLIGAYRFYSPIPQGDMWIGYLDFFMRLQDGDISAWWYQHNEHRMVFSRLLFYIDLRFFNGLSVPLIVVNVLFMFVIWLMHLRYAYYFTYQYNKQDMFFYLVALITVCTFSWKQDENITWAFQSQFWAAYVFPLLAFYFLAKSAEQTSVNQTSANQISTGRYYIFACVFGLLACVTMANGIFVLPLLAVMAILLKQSKLKVSVLVILTMVVLPLFVLSLETPAHHKSMFENISQIPFQTIAFFVEYLGSPLKIIVLSPVLGLFHLYLIFLAFKHYPKSKNNPLYLSVLAFFVFYLISAVLISMSRADLGLKFALVGRYTTPSFLSLILAIILYVHNHPHHFKFFNKKLILTIAILMLGTQIRTVVKNADKIFENEIVQAMQLEMGIHYLPEYQRVADRASQRNLSIFNIEPYVDKRERLGTRVDTSHCSKVEYKTVAKDDKRYKDIQGTFRVAIGQPIEQHKALKVIEDNIIIGYGVQSLNYPGVLSIILYNKQRDGINSFSLFDCKK